MQRRDKKIEGSDREARGKDTSTRVGGRSTNEGGGEEREEREEGEIGVSRWQGNARFRRGVKRKLWTFVPDGEVSGVTLYF